MTETAPDTVKVSRRSEGPHITMHVEEIVVRVDQEVYDVVSDPAGRQATHCVTLPRGLEHLYSWRFEALGNRYVRCTPIPLA